MGPAAAAGVGVGAAQLPGAQRLGVVAAHRQGFELGGLEGAASVQQIRQREAALGVSQLGLGRHALGLRQDLGVVGLQPRAVRLPGLPQQLQLGAALHAGFVQQVLRLLGLRQRAADLALKARAAVERDCDAQRQQPVGLLTVGVVVEGGAQGRVGAPERLRALDQRLRGGDARTCSDHVRALFEQGFNIGRAGAARCGPGAAGLPALGGRVLADPAGQKLRGLQLRQLGRLQIGLCALGLDAGARRVLRRQVTGLQAQLGAARQGLGAVGQRLHSQLPLLRGQQLVISAQRANLLLHAHVLAVGLGRFGGAFGGLGAQAALVAALPGPVQPQRFVEPTAGPVGTGAGAPLQVDRGRAGRERGGRGAVGHKHIGTRGLGGAACGLRLGVLARSLQHLWQVERVGRRRRALGLCRWPGQRGGQGQRSAHGKQVSYAHALFIRWAT